MRTCKLEASTKSVAAFIVATAILLTSTAPAMAFEVILTAKNGVPLDAAKNQMNALLQGPSAKKISNLRPVFSPVEQRILESSGKPILATAVKLTLSSEKDFVALRANILKSGFGLFVEPAELNFKPDIDLNLSLDGVGALSSKTAATGARVEANSKRGSNYENLQWALKNLGQKIAIAMDDLTSLFVAGEPGEDLGLDGAPAESNDPKRIIKVAVLDTGISFEHPELLDRVVENTAECRALSQLTKCLKDAEKMSPLAASTAEKAKCNGTYLNKDFDGNGYPLDCSGWDLTTGRMVGDQVWGGNDASDKLGHGTHVAGIIAARSDDDDGIRGVASNVRIIPIKVISASPNEPVKLKEVSTPNVTKSIDLTGVPAPRETEPKAQKGMGDLVARGLLYAVRSGAQVVNMSLGWPAAVDSNLMQQMVDLAKSRGILLVAAAGNDGTDSLIRPCVFEGVICVGSHDPDGALSHFSNHGAGVDIAAPGLGILSLFPAKLRSRIFTDRNGYEMKNGTSMASPYVAGLLARLLNHGYTPQEARARLLLGAREVKTNPRVPRERKAIVQSGNADLSKSFALPPQPLILPLDKKPLAGTWDRKNKSVPLKLKLENAWKAASSAQIEIQFEDPTANDVKISPSTLNVQNWPSGEVREFDLNLNVISERLDSELKATLVVTSVDRATGTKKTEKRYLAIELIAQPDLADPELETRPFSGNATLISNLSSSDIKTIASLDGDSKQDYFAFRSTQEGLQLTLLTQSRSNFNVDHSAVIPATEGSIQASQRLDLDNDGSSDYVIVWKQKPVKGKTTPSFLFRFFDARLKPLSLEFESRQVAEALYDNSVSVIDERFQWITVPASRGTQKVPAWITRGLTPELNKPAFDPWNPTPVDLPDFRLYVWTPKGLRSFLNGDRSPVGFLPPSEEEVKTGIRNVIWIHGSGTDATYERTEIRDFKVTSTSMMDLGGYRRIRQTMMAPIFDAGSSASSNSSGHIVGSGFYSDSHRATNRLTAYHRDSGVAFDKVVEPEAKTDAIASILAVYLGGREKSYFAQTIYEMQFENLATGETASTSLKRFSFMPQYFFGKLLFPILGEDRRSRSQDRIPMVYLLDGLGSANAIEIIAPRYENNRLIGLSRPARLRLAAPEGCETMGDVVEATNDKPTQIVFMCRDRAIFVPLKY